MDTEGDVAPETVAAVRDRYETVGSTAQVVVKEVAKAMEMDAEEYDRRVTGDVVATARDALFASTLRVHVGTRGEYENWLTDHPDYDVQEVGSENVDNVVWHPAPAAGTVVAATFHEERRAAVDTLRRQAFGRVYRPLVSAESDQDAGADADREL
jgi:hypothetical protein